jgi:diacylglycerol kinase family enzyme
MRALLIHNPTAGTGSHAAEVLEALLREASYSVTAVTTKQKGYKKALKQKADLILVAGGDGSVAKVIRALGDHHTPLAILPLGTANNIARTLGIQGEPEAVIESVRMHSTRPLDIGVVTGPWGKRRFVEGVGIGVLADWMQAGSSKPPAAERTRIGREQLRESLTETPSIRVHGSVDGYDLDEEVLFFEVLNTRFIGPALSLGPLSAPGDQLLDTVYLPPDKRAEAVSWLDSPNRLAPPFVVRQGRKVVLQWMSGFLHIDDRVWPHPGRPTELKLELEPKSLRFCAPPPTTS